MGFEYLERGVAGTYSSDALVGIRKEETPTASGDRETG